MQKNYNLEARNISFQYRKEGQMILKDVSLEFGNEEHVGLVAPSGFGKTTLCKILSGYIKPDQGEVYLNGRPLDTYQGYCPVQMIWQHPEQLVNPRLKMREVLAEGDEISPQIIKGLGIEADWLNRYPGEISGGEMQRFCIARALGKRTRFLLADEISTMLDLITQSQIWHFLMNEVRERRIGLITVSHNDELLKQICSKVVDLMPI
jgi:peptide/nickel transport system ATP-binding protein